MGLVLGVRKNSRFYVGDTKVTVKNLHGFTGARLIVHTDPPTEYDITDKFAVPIMPDVLVSCGTPSEEIIEQRARFAARVENEKRQRDEALASGKLTLEEYDNLPEMELPHFMFPRLVISAPRHVKIMREALYKKAVCA